MPLWLSGVEAIINHAPDIHSSPDGYRVEAWGRILIGAHY
jgi:hypothetical protein